MRHLRGALLCPGSSSWPTSRPTTHSNRPDRASCENAVFGRTSKLGFTVNPVGSARSHAASRGRAVLGPPGHARCLRGLVHNAQILRGGVNATLVGTGPSALDAAHSAASSCGCFASLELRPRRRRVSSTTTPTAGPRNVAVCHTVRRGLRRSARHHPAPPVQIYGRVPPRRSRW